MTSLSLTARGGLRQMADGVARLIPVKERILDAAAQWPPQRRSRASFRFFSALARRTNGRQGAMLGNLGISAALKCELPPTHMVALYGLPRLYAGERGALELAARLSRSSTAFVDIGAHVGYFTLFVHQHGAPGLPIYFFEPDRTLYAALARNVRSNGLTRIHGHDHAIGATDGVARFFVNDTDSLSGSLQAEFAAGHQITPIDVTLERFETIARRLDLRRACVKVDVEGAEYAFLDGAGDSLDRVDYLIMEVLAAAHARGFVSAMMRQGRFHAYYINDYSLEHSVDGSFTYRAPEYNWLFCRETPDELRRTIGHPPLSVHAGARPR